MRDKISFNEAAVNVNLNIESDGVIFSQLQLGVQTKFI